MTFEPSIVGLFIQTAGISLVAILSYLVNRSIGCTPLHYWTGAWASLSAGLTMLLLASTIPGTEYLQAGYLLGEYAFGFLLVAGCHNYATGAVISRRHFWTLAPATLLAIGLPYLAAHTVNIVFVPQAAILTCFFVAAFLALRPARGPERGQGLGVMRLALVLLSLSFAHYVPVFAFKSIGGPTSGLTYLEYSAMYDLILQVVLSFSMVMLITESARAELELAHREAAQARDRLEVLARLDPMTESLNRHAFYSLVDRHGRAAPALNGCVVLVDVDGLKHINDSYGHMAGDLAIRNVAKAIRSLVRADDLLFRWGGDEFLVLLFGLPDAEARRRFDGINDLLGETVVPMTDQRFTLSVSVGIAAIEAGTPLDTAIAQADSAMYRQKQGRHASRVAS